MISNSATTLQDLIGAASGDSTAIVLPDQHLRITYDQLRQQVQHMRTGDGGFYIWNCLVARTQSKVRNPKSEIGADFLHRIQRKASGKDREALQQEPLRRA